MHSFEPTVTVESKALAGVKITVRRLSQIERAKRDFAIAEQQVRTAEIRARMAEIRKPYEPTESFLEGAAEAAYEAYRATTGGKSLATGQEIPVWAELRPAIQAAWESSAQAVAALAVAEPQACPFRGAGREMPLAERVELTRLDHELGLLINMHLKPATIRSGLVSIEGVDYAGKPATADLLLANGPDVLIDEAWIAVVEHSGLTPVQEKNSQSPTTSPG